MGKLNELCVIYPCWRSADGRKRLGKQSRYSWIDLKIFSVFAALRFYSLGRFFSRGKNIGEVLVILESIRGGKFSIINIFFPPRLSRKNKFLDVEALVSVIRSVCEKVLFFITFIVRVCKFIQLSSPKNVKKKKKIEVEK